MTRQTSDSSSTTADRYDRSIRLLTQEGQDAITESHVVLVGCGGIGSLVAQQLARLGVTAFTLVDPDVVEETNLPRLVGAFDTDVGREKVGVIRETIQKTNPEADVRTVADEIENQAGVLARGDVVIGAVDWLTTRMFLNEQAVRLETPYIDVGAVIDVNAGEDVTTMEAYIQFIRPGENACFECLDRVDLNRVRKERLMRQGVGDEGVRRGYLNASDREPEPAIITLNGVAVSLAAEQFIKHVTMFDEPADFLRYDALANEVSRLSTSRRADCLVCGDEGLLGMDGSQDVVTKDDPFKPGTVF